MSCGYTQAIKAFCSLTSAFHSSRAQRLAVMTDFPPDSHRPRSDRFTGKHRDKHKTPSFPAYCTKLAVSLLSLLVTILLSRMACASQEVSASTTGSKPLHLKSAFLWPPAARSLPAKLLRSVDHLLNRWLSLLRLTM